MKIKQILMAAAFWICILGPNLLFPIFKNESDESTGENRNLASFPVFSFDTINSFPASVEDYINDHAAFRNRFLSLNSTINLALFRNTDASTVILGKEGWYFYNAGSTIEDFLGINRFSDQELEKISSMMQDVSDYYEARGIQFIFISPPNKENVYSEYLPDEYKRVSTPTRRDALITYLRENTSVPILDPGPYFLENQDYQWYLKSDTHWNDAAGFIASQMVIEAAGGTPVPLEQVTIEYVPTEMGDLALQFNMPERYNEETKAVVTNYYDNSEIKLEDPTGDGNIVYLSNPEALDQRRLAIYRDSFGIALSSFLPKYFANTDFYHWREYTPQLLEENPPDIILYEIVERDLGRILDDLTKLAPELFK